MNKYLATCVVCGGFTSRKYAALHAGQCKTCTEPDYKSARPHHPTRNERIIEHGYTAYALEEGHYDQGDFT